MAIVRRRQNQHREYTSSELDLAPRNSRFQVCKSISVLAASALAASASIRFLLREQTSIYQPLNVIIILTPIHLVLWCMERCTNLRQWLLKTVHIYFIVIGSFELTSWIFNLPSRPYQERSLSLVESLWLLLAYVGWVCFLRLVVAEWVLRRISIRKISSDKESSIQVV